MNAAFKRVSQHREKERLFAQDDISSCAKMKCHLVQTNALFLYAERRV